MHGPDPLVEGKQLAFEAQIREDMKNEMEERGIKGGEAGTMRRPAAALPSVMERARQGLQALGRKMGWSAGASNNPPPAVGEVGGSVGG
jgi:hypothetical protein